VNYSVIIAGGKGERFWPLSRLDRPKQFLQLTSNKTMLEETIDRVKP
jgi:mannose-1-phosphate guanylyltransferase